MVRVRQAAPQLHAPRDRLLRRGRADLGPPLGRRGHRHAARGARVPADRERDPAGVRAGVAVLLLERRRQRRPRPPPGAVRRVLPGARGQRRARQLHRAAGAGDRRVRLHQEPRHTRRRRPRRPRRRRPPPLRARLLAARPRGDLGEGARRAAGADLPDDPRQGHLRAGRRPLARREDVRLQRVGRRERGGAAAARVRALEPRHRAHRLPQPRLVRHDRSRQHRHLAHGHGHAHRRPREGAARPAPRQLRLRPRARPPRLHDHRGAGRGVLGPRAERRHALARARSS